MGILAYRAIFNPHVQRPAQVHCLVRYDNEIGKGDHMHYSEQQIPYQSVSRTRLMADGINDVKRLPGGKLGWKDF